MKGGVGKTTTVMMLANIYSKCGKKVLVLDLDLYNGNLAFAYNAKVRGSIYNLCDDMANNRLKNGINEDYATKVDKNIYLISSPKDPRQANKINNKYLNNILESLRFTYDVIIVDTSHILSVSNMIAFSNSDRIVDIVTNDSFDLQNTKTFVAICKNMEVENLVLVLNEAMDNRKTFFTNYDIKSITKKSIDYTIPSSLYLKNFDQLVMDGKLSNFDEQIKGDAKKSFQNFASHMLTLIEDEEEEINEKN